MEFGSGSIHTITFPFDVQPGSTSISKVIMFNNNFIDFIIAVEEETVTQLDYTYKIAAAPGGSESKGAFSVIVIKQETFYGG
jgi:hypothetical protein